MNRILLLQARDADDPMLAHELDCFVERTGVDRNRFHPLNMAALAPEDWPEIAGFDGAMVGGSGDYSVVKGGFDWHRPMLDYTLDIIHHGLPLFASCFGFQAIIQALGGEVVTDDSMAEVGTHEVYLTDGGKEDDFFGALPERFDAQFGHNDSASRVPDELVLLAGTERCPHQAIRMPDKPVWATQFHPELDEEGNKTRYIRYLVNYAHRPLSPTEASARAAEIHRPSPHANALLGRFLDVLAAR